MKVCPKCKQELSLSCFPPDPTRYLGVGSWCKECRAETRHNRLIRKKKEDPNYQIRIDEELKGNKYCNKCKSYKPLDQFYKDKSHKTGIRSTCKTCSSSSQKDHYLKNKETIRLSHKEYIKNNYDKILENDRERYRKNRSKILEQKKQKYQEDKERYLNIAKDYRENNREKISEGMRIYYRQNTEVIKDRIKAYRSTPNGRVMKASFDHKRKSRESTSKITLTPDQWELCLLEVSNHCPMCGARFSKHLKAQIDHIYPLSRGGDLTYWNVQPLCKSCNSSKYKSVRPDHEIRKAQTIANRLASFINQPIVLNNSI